MKMHPFLYLTLFSLTIIFWPFRHSHADTPPSAGNPSGVRACLFVPGKSVPAQMPGDLSTRTKAPPPPAKPVPNTPDSPEKTAQQLTVLDGLSNAVSQNYVYTNFRSHDWKAMTAKFRTTVQQGMGDAAFYAGMKQLILELGDEHSYFQNPEEVKDDEAKLASQYNFVGVGALFKPIEGTDNAAIMSLFTNSPAAQAGLLPHDILLKVDGGPVRTESGVSRTLGAEGTTVKLTVQHPGESPRDLTLTRRRVAGILPIDYCIVPQTRIGYIFLPTLLDKTMDAQVREALKKMTADGPLQGLVLDNRLNGGGLGSVAKAIMGLFAGGPQGAFVNRAGKQPLDLSPENIGGSQSVPLVVLVDVDTVSYGEIMSGVLRVAGRAKIVGGKTLGNVEQLRQYKFADGSRLWLASETFQPRGMANGVWEDTGIIPDVMVPTRWDLFTEANDPGLGKAVEILNH